MWLALLQYSLYCRGLEPNPKYLWGVPIFLPIKLVSPGSQSPNKSTLNSALSDFRSIPPTPPVALGGFLRPPGTGATLMPVSPPHKLHVPSSCAFASLRAGSFLPLHFIPKSKPYNKFTSEEIYLFSKGQPHKVSKKCKLKQGPFFTYEVGKNERNYIFYNWQGCGQNGHCHLPLVRG